MLVIAGVVFAFGMVVVAVVVVVTIVIIVVTTAIVVVTVAVVVSAIVVLTALVIVRRLTFSVATFGRTAILFLLVIGGVTFVSYATGLTDAWAFCFFFFFLVEL